MITNIIAAKIKNSMFSFVLIKLYWQFQRQLTVKLE